MSGESKVTQAIALGSYFLSGCLAINVSQVIGAPLYLVNEDWYNSWISFTKQSFNLLTITLTQWWAPTTVRVSGDASMRGQLFKSVEGNLMCNFPKRLILIANHQIYTDWLYLWWIAHCADAAGRVYIILKESLKRIPVIGWGIQLSQFILLKRNWEKDKPHLSKHLQKLNNHDPMWLLLFPEGTNLAPSTRLASRKWAAKNSIPDMQHTLHPRTTGLQFCLQELRQTVGHLYDCTIAYEGVPRGQYAQDIYTLQAQYLNGKPPKKVHMYWRRFPISEIPIDNIRSFESWLRARWIEKDAYVEHYYRTGQMPCDRGITVMPDGTKRKGCGYIETAIQATAWHEFLRVFAPIGALSLVLYSIYNQLPQNFMSSVNNISKKAVMDQAKSIGESSTTLKKALTVYPGTPTLAANADKVSSQRAIAPVQKATKQTSISNTQKINAMLPANLVRNSLAISNAGSISGSTRRSSLTSTLPRFSTPGSSQVSNRARTTTPVKPIAAVSNTSGPKTTVFKKAPSTVSKTDTTTPPRKLPAVTGTSTTKSPVRVPPKLSVKQSTAQFGGPTTQNNKPTTLKLKTGPTISKSGTAHQPSKPLSIANKLTAKPIKPVETSKVKR